MAFPLTEVQVALTTLLYYITYLFLLNTVDGIIYVIKYYEGKVVKV